VHVSYSAEGYDELSLWCFQSHPQLQTEVKLPLEVDCELTLTTETTLGQRWTENPAP